METPRRLLISSHDSPPLSSQVNWHPSEELCEEEVDSGITPSVAPGTNTVEDNSSENDIVPTVLIERQIEFLRDTQDNVSNFFPRVLFCAVTCFNRW